MIEPRADEVPEHVERDPSVAVAEGGFLLPRQVEADRAAALHGGKQRFQVRRRAAT
jgi:hypothetical protein